MRRLFLFAVFLLAACATPQEECISESTKDYRIVTRLIEETEENLLRGYGTEWRRYYSWESRRCGYRKDGSAVYCRSPRLRQYSQKVYFDPEAELKKLDDLRVRQAKLAPDARKSVASCKASFPEPV